MLAAANMPRSGQDTAFDRQARQEILKKRLSVLRAEQIEILRELNDTTEISRLPNELLLFIFLLAIPEFPVARDAPTYRYGTVTGPRRHREDSAAFVLTHVCYRWRELASAYPQLWTNISVPSFSPEAVTLALSRSKNSGFNLSLNLTTPVEYQRQRSVSKLLPSIHHVRHLHFEYPHDVDETLRVTIWEILHLRNLDLSNLQTLSIPFPAPRFLANYMDDVSSFFEPLIKKATNLLTLRYAVGRPRSLQPLKLGTSLVNVSLQMHDPIGSLRNPLPQHERNILLHDILDVLTGLPRLQSLELRIDISKQWDAVEKHVTLPGVLKLRLFGSSNNCALFMQAVQVESLTCFYAKVTDCVKADTPLSHKREFVDAISLISGVVARSSGQLAGLKFIQAGNGRLGVALYNGFVSLDGWTAPQPRFEVTGFDYPHAAALLEHPDFPPLDTESLWIHTAETYWDEEYIMYGPEEPPKLYAALRRKLATIDEIRISGCDVHTMGKILFAKDENITPFPRLDRIYCYIARGDNDSLNNLQRLSDDFAERQLRGAGKIRIFITKFCRPTVEYDLSPP